MHVSLLVLCAALGPLAVDVPSLASHPRLDEGLRQQWTQLLWERKDAPPSAAQRVAVLVRFGGEASPTVTKELEAAGVVWGRLEGRIAHVGPFYGATVDQDALRALLSHPDVVRVSGVPEAFSPLPADQSMGKAHQWTQAWPAWWRRDAQMQRYQGTGVTLCDFDTAADIFHPLLFRADAGRFVWLDVNHNGVLDVGVDAVDLNGDGTAQVEEHLQVLGGGVAHTYQGAVTFLSDVLLAPHFLYADTNGSGLREYGTAEGFQENTPGYGEPMFIEDDVNANGLLDPDERLIRLGSSKVKGVYRPSQGRAYLRGVDLIETPIVTDAFHGTGVAGILVGGVFDRTAVQGVAPDADLLMVVQASGPGEISGAQYDQNRVTAFSWCETQGARVFVHEYGTPIIHFADGSSDWEQMLDVLSSRGLVQATAAHNFAGNTGRARLMLDAQEVRRINVTISNYNGTGYNLDRIMGLARWRGAVNAVDLQLITPDGVTLDGSQQIPPTTSTHAMNGTRDASTRGTGKISFTYAQLGANNRYLPLTQGVFQVEIRNTTAAPQEVFLYLAHNTAYAVWLALDLPVHDDTSSMAWPSTADSAVAVAAFQVNTILAGVEGSRLTYSGRGPRIDGQTTVAVTAPADHYTALNNGPGGPGNITVFSGTSGALPQVAGAIALLLQKEPELSTEDVHQRLLERAQGDTLTGAVPNNDWGGGRLDVYRLLFGQAAPEHAAPQLVVQHPACVAKDVAAVWDAAASTAATGGALVFRFDVDANGTLEHQGGSQFTHTSTAAGPATLLLEAEDTDGLTTSQLFSFEVMETCPGGSPGGGGGDGGLALPGCTQTAPGLWMWLGLVMVALRPRRVR
jgi:subtilisin family serine protease